MAKKIDDRDRHAWNRYRDGAKRAAARKAVSPESMEVVGFIEGFRAGLSAGKREASKRAQ